MPYYENPQKYCINLKCPTDWNGKGVSIISIHLKATSHKRSGLKNDSNWF